MNLLRLSDAGLAELRQSVASEARRRARAATNGNDPACIVFGNEAAKRAVTIAAAGKHSILFIGPAKCGKTMLRAVCLALGVDESFEARLCPCGNWTDPLATCRCTPAQLKRTRAKFPSADITVEVCRPSIREQGYRGTSLDEMRDHARSADRFTDLRLDEPCQHLLRACVVELGLDTETVELVLAVARTIANLDHSPEIQAVHLCEAINYRPRCD